MRPFMILLGVILMSASGYSYTWYIPDDYGSIQEAIDAVLDGDTIIVKPGTYVENIDFMGKAITIRSELGPNNTVIDGNEAGSVVTFQNGEGLDSVLEGFTISNGSVNPGDGGGINCQQASPTIKNNIITGNRADFLGNGGGICCYDASPTIINNTISGNKAVGWYSDGQGGGIFCYNSSAKIINNTITENTTYDPSTPPEGGGICCKGIGVITISYNTISGNSAGYGGGIYCESNDATISHNTISGNYGGLGGGICCWFLDSLSTITNNAITGNEAGYGGGIYCCESSPTVTNNTIFGNMSYYSGGGGGGIYCEHTSSPIITNTIIWNNDALTGKEIYVGSTSLPSTLTISYSDVKGGQALIYVDPGCTLNWGPGMIDADPLFLDPLNDDYHLTYASPCIDAGDNYASSLPATDFEGDPRIFPGNGKGVYLVGSPPPGAIVDMGADEYCLLKRQKVIPK